MTKLYFKSCVTVRSKCGKIVVFKVKQFIMCTKYVVQKVVVKAFLGPFKLCFSVCGIHSIYVLMNFGHP